jgi:hypothetical protein
MRKGASSGIVAVLISISLAGVRRLSLTSGHMVKNRMKPIEAGAVTPRRDYG